MTTTPEDGRYEPSEIESAWQSRWAADRSSEIDVDRADRDRTFYNLVEFPYPSAEGLHVGHAYTYSGADTYGRYLRMRGREVFQPIGFDSFGIHTENYALKVGEHPGTLTERTIANYRRQLASLGAAWAAPVGDGDVGERDRDFDLRPRRRQAAASHAQKRLTRIISPPRGRHLQAPTRPGRTI